MGIRARGEASILHADLDSFYASVEQRDDPALRGRPVLVGGGVVLAASYEAKACGVRTPTNVPAARRLCPDAVVVPPRMRAYSEASARVFEIFRDTTPVVEPISIDEAFLDVGGLHRLVGAPIEIARALRERVRREAGLPITVGIATRKFLAKIASAVAKPDGLLLVPPGTELEFLHPLPIERLWGVGEVTATKLHAHGIRTIGQLADLSPDLLRDTVGGAAGQHLHALANALDPRPVDVGRRRRSIGSQRAMRAGSKSHAELEASLIAIVDRLGKRLRTAERSCRTVVLRLRHDDYTRITRSRTLPQATVHTATLLDLARDLLREAMPLIDEKGCTLLGLSFANLNDDGSQPSLPFEEADTDALDVAIDAVRDRYGSSSITRGVLLGHDPGIQVPTLPDR